MLGNDIVDLNHLPDAERSLSLPYLSKICSDREIEKILNSNNPIFLLWRIWTMKESAYKIAIKLGAERAFNPKKFETFPIDEASGLVSSDFGTMLCETNNNELFMHTVAFLPKSKAYKSGEMLYADNQSAAVRHALIGDYLVLYPNAQNNEVIMQNGIPQLISDSDKIDVSLSHHGSYISWAFELP
jgi:phosphopantetheinyl transferase (holo-ACP synthase)